ncbi:NUT family member 2G-like [Heterocephalus glaber]|uniref:NUT family member 2G-like n=1 Tax=Heterocephalus glaber TaxID=10181 RepID=A0AAX6S3D2_HETGA|nr:NUT family member 2G-like [Heterocephalus glaber]
MLKEDASSVLQPATTLKSGVIPSPSAVLRPLPPASVPTQQLYWEPPPPPFGNAPPPRGNPLVLSPFPMTPVVAGHGGYGKPGAGPFNIMAQAGRARRPAGSLPTQSTLLTQAPRMRGAPGVRHWAVQNPAPLQLRAPPMPTFMPAPIRVSNKVDDRMRPWGPCPSAVPPVARAMSRVNTGPPPHCNYTECGLAASQANTSTDRTCKSPSAYENFRRWQYLKTLLQEHFPQTPDMEALSCFLVPVLRSLSRWQPTMSVEKSLQIGIQEWDRTSNYNRMTFYEVAEKFMEFEAAEKMEHPGLQLTGGLPGQPIPAPPRPKPPRPPMPKVVQQPVCVPRQADSKAQAACPPAPESQQPPESKAPDEIPPEAVKEYMEIMDWLEEHHLLVTEEPEENQEEKQDQEEDDLYPDLLSYCDELCSQEDFVDKVEAIINPKFLEQVESTDVETDIVLAGSEVLEEEHALTLDQLVDKRLLDSKTKGGVCRPQSQGPSQSAVHRGAEQDDCDLKRRVNQETCPAPKAPRFCKRRRATNEELPGPEVPAVLRRQCCLTGDAAPVGKVSRPGPSCQVSGGQDLAQGLVPRPRPKKRRRNKLGSQRRRKT